MQMLHRHLLERHTQDRQVVMFVEESQSMPLATLEEIRLLSNLETAHAKLLQIVLFGQPELEDNLSQPQIRQLRERITQSFRLSPLKSGEIRDYLNFRLRAAGYGGPDLFSPRAINAIARASRGLTRRVNLIADKALLVAFSESTHTIVLRHIKAAVRDSEFSSYEPPRSRFRLGLALLLVAVGVSVGIALFALFQAYQDGRVPARIPMARTDTPPKEATASAPAEAPTPAEAAAASPAPAAAPAAGALEAAAPAVPIATPLASEPVASSVPAPLTPAATQEPVAAPPVVALTDAGKGIFLQLGAFGSQDNANNYLAQLRAQIAWLAPALHVYPRGGLFRVHAGPYADQAEARTAADRIHRELGIKTIVLVR